MFVNKTKQGILVTNWMVQGTNFKRPRVEIDGKVLHWSINNFKTINKKDILKELKILSKNNPISRCK
jgi:hypothetical protein